MARTLRSRHVMACGAGCWAAAHSVCETGPRPMRGCGTTQLRTRQHHSCVANGAEPCAGSRTQHTIRYATVQPRLAALVLEREA